MTFGLHLSACGSNDSHVTSYGKLSRLRDLQRLYFESANIDDFYCLVDATLAKQMFNILPPSVREFVHGKRPTNAEQIAAEADLAFQCSKVNEGVAPRYDAGHRFGFGHTNASQFKPKFTPRITDPRFRHAAMNNGIYAPRPAMQRTTAATGTSSPCSTETGSQDMLDL